MEQKIFIACFLGALIGALTGINLGIGWFGGGLIGFFVGYIAYDFKRVTRATKSVALEIHEEISGWRPDTEWWFYAAKYVFSGMRFGFTVALGPSLVWAYFATETRVERALVLTVILTLFFGFAFAALTEDLTKDQLKRLCKNAPVQNPIKFWLWTFPKWTITWLYRFIRFACRITSRIPRFVVSVIRLIHSDIRLLCGTCAAIGAVIGFAFGNPILGAFVGGALGVASHELISKRILKLAS